LSVLYFLCCDLLLIWSFNVIWCGTNENEKQNSKQNSIQNSIQNKEETKKKTNWYIFVFVFCFWNLFVRVVVCLFVLLVGLFGLLVVIYMFCTFCLIVCIALFCCNIIYVFVLNWIEFSFIDLNKNEAIFDLLLIMKDWIPKDALKTRTNRSKYKNKIKYMAKAHETYRDLHQNKYINNNVQTIIVIIQTTKLKVHEHWHWQSWN
jgi:hypothetical protein